MTRYDRPLPGLLAIDIRFSRDTLNLRRLKEPKRLERMVKMQISETDGGVRFASLLDLLCANNSRTSYAEEDVPLQFDASHLTAQGSIFLAKSIKASSVSFLRKQQPAANVVGFP